MASFTSLLHPNEPLLLGEVTGAIYNLNKIGQSLDGLLLFLLNHLKVLHFRVFFRICRKIIFEISDSVEELGMQNFQIKLQ